MGFCARAEPDERATTMVNRASSTGKEHHFRFVSIFLRRGAIKV